jgi:hypothetical protein
MVAQAFLAHQANGAPVGLTTSPTQTALLHTEASAQFLAEEY